MHALSASERLAPRALIDVGSPPSVARPYEVGDYYDEMFHAEGCPRPGYEQLYHQLQALSTEELQRHQQAADHAMLQQGITFQVYGDEQGGERIIPFDIVPRIICAREWATIEQGLQQRTMALNCFLQDVYHEQRALKEGIIPAEIVRTSSAFRTLCVGLQPPRGVWCHITGTDLVRDDDGQYYVLEDNLRCPSGVSYVLQNRRLMKQTFPQLFGNLPILPVDDYGSRLLQTLQSLGPSPSTDTRVALLTPGITNAAYFEHSYLAQQTGMQLVEGRDLVVANDRLHVRTTRGYERVDVLYRRIDDDFLDPLAFRPDSLLGVPGLLEIYRQGKVAIANAPGTGVADDKVVYAYVPEMIRFFLGEEPILPNVPTFVCHQPQHRAHVLANLDKLVVKPANESGGYGMLIGPQASAAERRDFAERIRTNPRNYIAQPTLNLSRVPILSGDGLAGRHVDLRPFTLYGEHCYVLPGGLTRVALPAGSLVVNSSQGGGSKDTWVLSEQSAARPRHATDETEACHQGRVVSRADTASLVQPTAKQNQPC